MSENDKEDPIELFRCFSCGEYRPISQLVQTKVVGFNFYKNFCSVCVDKIKIGIPISENPKQRQPKEAPNGKTSSEVSKSEDTKK